MKNSPRFNYIITIHNKEDLIEKVLTSVLVCCRDNSFIYPILDGCTDNTEKIIDSIIEKYSNIPINKIYTSDVHELLSINAGLKSANQSGEGFNIILQDDVILADFKLEEKITKLYQWGDKKLGCVSLRLGANFATNIIESNELVPQQDYLENIYGHELPYAKTFKPNHFSYRDIAIKSPICLPFYLIKEVGILEEKLAPYGHDDLEYAIRCYEAGYQNGVFAIKFYSNLEWGGTRTTIQPEMRKIIRRNINNIKKWNKKSLEKIVEQKKDLIIYKIINTSTKETTKLKTTNQKESLNKIQQNDIKLILIKAKNYLKNRLKENKFTNKILLKIKKHRNIRREKQRFYPFIKFNKTFNVDINFTNALKYFKHPNKTYSYMHYYFHHFLPKEIKKHRLYFSQEKRGFGENAFHSMWWLLLKEFKPKNCLEIGVYRGQTISLWSLIAKKLQFNCQINGISPFKPIGDSVSSYPKDVNYLNDTQDSFKHFNLPKANLIKALSTDDKAVKFIKSKKWDLIYIDGNHDYDVVLADYKLCKEYLTSNGLIVFDDSSLGTSYIPPFFSSAGRPGPSDIVKNYAMKELLFLGTIGHNNIFKNK